MTDKLDPFDVKALEGSLNDSATRVSAIWISFLVFGLYLVIAAGTVTHRQLFLEDPVKLPVLNIDLPMVGFFFLAPILFVVFHTYVLIQVLLLGRTAVVYNEAVEYNVKFAEDNARVRQRLANTLFAQIFAGSPRERKGWLGLLLLMLAWLTLTVAPILVLLVFQFQFLPYHSYLVTWTLRGLIVLDLIAVLVFWPALRNPDRGVSLRVILWSWIPLLPFGLGVVAFSWICLTFPGESHADWTRYWPDQSLVQVDWERYGPEGTEDTIIECRTVSPISKAFAGFDRINLPHVDIIDHEKLRNIESNTKSDSLPDFQGERTRRIRDRHLDCADLSEFSDLRRIDLTNASLRGAFLNRARLQGASLEHVQLRGASLLRAQLQGASLNNAQLQGAHLAGAELQGAFLLNARHQGAYLGNARLQGASLDYAQLQGASLDSARLQGASLDKAKLQGTSLFDAQLQGAHLGSAELQGAFLEGANLQGAYLYRAALQGANFTRSALEHAQLLQVSVWRAKNADCQGARVAVIDQERLRSDIVDFIDSSLEDVPDIQKNRAIKNMRAGLVGDPAKDDTAQIARAWDLCAQASKLLNATAVENQLTRVLRQVVCEATENREAIAAGIIAHWVFGPSPVNWISTRLAGALLGEDGNDCAVKYINEVTKERLRSFLPAGPSSGPN